MPAFEQGDSVYARARAELLYELLRGGIFDMDEHERGATVARIVRQLERRHPELDEQTLRRLLGEGMQHTGGDASAGGPARRERRGPD